MEGICTQADFLARPTSWSDTEPGAYADGEVSF